MNSQHALLVSSAIWVFAGTSRAQANFTPIGTLGTRPTAMSSDGVWITGAGPAGGQTFRWSLATGISSFNSGSDGFADIAIGGSPVAATLVNTNGDEVAGLWTPGGSTLLPDLGGQSGTSISSVYAASDDASVVVGLGWINAGQAHGFQWSLSTGLTLDLGAQGGGSSRANGVAGNGAVVTGWDEDPSGFRRPSLWSGGTEVVIDPNPGEAWAVNHDGSFISGVLNSKCFRRTAGGVVDLGKLPGSAPADEATGLGISDDGNTIVGSNGNPFFGTPFRAFIWRPGAGMVDLKTLLLALGAGNAANFGLSSAVSVSANGRTIAGGSGAFPFGPFQGWVATLPEVATIFCTPQVNSAGCTPSIAFNGTPSASSGAGFHVTATNITRSKPGILLYGKSGAASLPFNGGTLCVGGALVHTAGQSSGGNTPCGGSFDFDFNAYVATGVDAALIGGAQVWAQYLSRDPLSAGHTNLTDAITFTLWP